MSITISLQIGNSDNKLTQLEWSEYVEKTESHIRAIADAVYFVGFSLPNAPYQNACFVFKVLDAPIWDMVMYPHLQLIAQSYRQDSIAYLKGESKFITTS
jgi:hypothetical protein